MLKGKNGETCWPSHPEIQSQIKTKTTRQNGATRCIPMYRNGCKNSEKILWMIEFLNTETPTPVLLMNHVQSLRLREVRIWVNTVFILTSLKTEIARSVRGPKSQGPRAGDVFQSRTSCRKFWWFDCSRPQSSQWRAWISQQSSICSRCAGLGQPMDPVVSVQNKNFSGNTEELAKALGAE